MNQNKGFSPRRRIWDVTKIVLWKLSALGGDRYVQRGWIVYSLAKAFGEAYIKKEFTSEPQTEFVRRSVKKGQICFDIGANVGSYTHLLSTMVGPSGKVHSFEPIPSTFSVLSKRVAIFRLENVICHPNALGERRGIVEFVGGNGRPGTRSLAHLKAPYEKGVQTIQNIPMNTLDEMMADQNINHVEFVKCDVEGFELMVFKGGQKMLSQYRPIVLCELEEQWMRYNHTTTDVFLFFRALQYSSFVWHEGGLTSVDAVIPLVNNYIFLPDERVDAVTNELTA